MHLKSITVVFSNKSHPFCMYMSACRCTVASYKNHSRMAMLLHILVDPYCIIMWPLYRGQPNDFFLDTLSKFTWWHTFHGYCVDVASLQIVHVSVWTCVCLYKCKHTLASPCTVGVDFYVSASCSHSIEARRDQHLSDCLHNVCEHACQSCFCMYPY